MLSMCLILLLYVFGDHIWLLQLFVSILQDRLKKRAKFDATTDVNYDLLVTLKNYDGWFNAILKVCRHKDMKQEYLAIEFEKIKSEYIYVFVCVYVSLLVCLSGSYFSNA